MICVGNGCFDPCLHLHRLALAVLRLIWPSPAALFRSRLLPACVKPTVRASLSLARRPGLPNQIRQRPFGQDFDDRSMQLCAGLVKGDVSVNRSSESQNAPKIWPSHACTIANNETLTGGSSSITPPFAPRRRGGFPPSRGARRSSKDTMVTRPEALPLPEVTPVARCPQARNVNRRMATMEVFENTLIQITVIQISRSPVNVKSKKSVYKAGLSPPSHQTNWRAARITTRVR